MVYSTSDKIFWNKISNISDLPLSFIIKFQDNLNWEIFLNHSKYTLNILFLKNFEKHWINNILYKNLIFDNTVLTELQIAVYPDFVDWKVNLLQNHLSKDFILTFKSYIYRYIISLDFTSFLYICNCNNIIYDIFLIDYLKYNNKTNLLKEIIQYLNQPRLVDKWIKIGYDYEGIEFNLF